MPDDTYPCIFYPDLYGAHYVDKGKDEIFLEKCMHLEQLMEARRQFAYGQQRDYFDHPNCIGWTRADTDENKGSARAVLLSNGDDGFKTMEIGQQHSGKTFIDYLGKHPAEVIINEEGWGEFHVPAGSVAVWVQKPE